MIPHERLEQCAASDVRNRTAVVCGRRSATYGELRDAAYGLAGQLAVAGIARGDVGIVLVGSSIEFAISYFACSYLGALFMPLDQRLTVAEAVGLAAIAEPTFLITGPESGEMCMALLESVEGWRAVVGTDPVELPAANIVQLSFDTGAPSACHADFIPAALGPEDATALLATSGTTGQPKLAMLPARAWDLFLHALETCWGVGPGSAGVLPVPMSHISGPIYLNACVHFPMKLVVMARYSPKRLLEQVRAHRPMFCNVTPSMARVLIDRLGPDELREIGATTKVAVFGAPMSPSYLDEFTEKLGVPPQSGYGLTEAAPLTCITPLERGVHRVGSLGKPVEMEGHEVRVVNEDGRDCAQGEVGEILIGGPSLMLGYYRDERATADVLHDGWLYTGDLGMFDEEGYLYIVGRKKEVILVHGFNVLPEEVESVLAAHSGVKEVAAAGERHPRSGECVVAYVVRRPGSTVSSAELIDWARASLAAHKVPREIRFVTDFPRTASGKVARAALHNAPRA